jgi:hypothetical protein
MLALKRSEDLQSKVQWSLYMPGRHTGEEERDVAQQAYSELLFHQPNTQY